MSTKVLEDLFKSELGTSVEKPLIECPHCDHPITKSDVINKAKNAASNNMSHDNKEGGHHRGPASGPNKATPTRVKGGKKQDEVIAVGKSEACDDSSGADDASMDKAEGITSMPAKTETAGARVSPATPKAPAKPATPSVAVNPAGPRLQPTMKSMGTPYVQYVDTGEDERIAKSIAEGALGDGGFVTKPLDLYNRK